MILFSIAGFENKSYSSLRAICKDIVEYYSGKEKLPDFHYIAWEGEDGIERYASDRLINKIRRYLQSEIDYERAASRKAAIDYDNEWSDLRSYFYETRGCTH